MQMKSFERGTQVTTIQLNITHVLLFVLSYYYYHIIFVITRLASAEVKPYLDTTQVW